MAHIDTVRVDGDVHRLSADAALLGYTACRRVIPTGTLVLHEQERRVTCPSCLDA